ncbi:MAG: potassium/proton antiporter [Propionibacteriaceae bacterium]|jgi:cell volume regulation protein A|nr:potassium/proton antiporter [Propionibacteriaceae bacterium]
MSLDLLLLLGALIVLAGVGAAKLGDRLGLPALLLFLALGVILGFDDALSFNSATLAHDLGFAALVVILTEGGLATKWREIKPAVIPAILLCSAGVAITIALQSVFGFFALGLPLATAVLLAAIMAPTDSAAVFSVLKHVPLPAKIRSVLEGESGLNDAPSVLFVIAATELAMGTLAMDVSLAWTGLLIIAELLGGIAFGALFGYLGVRTLRSLALPASGLYPLAVIGWAVVAYGLGVVLHISGFAAVYVCAVVLGNGKLPHRHAARSFADGMAWIAQIGLFVMLGLLVDIRSMKWEYFVIAILGGLVLTFVVRPIAVWLCTIPFAFTTKVGKPRRIQQRFTLAEKAFVSWGGLRGAVPIVLATIPMAYGLDNATTIFDITFITVVFLTLINGPTLPWVAKILGLAGEAFEVDIEVAPLDEADADMMTISVSDQSKLHGVTVAELGLPPNAQVSLIIRGERMFTPHGRDIIQAGDQLLMVTPTAVRDKIEERMKLVDRGGRLAGWLRRDN